MIFNVAIMIVGLVVLVLGGDFLVRGASSLAFKMKLSPLVVGLTIVAFGTSAPELLVSVKSALSGSSDIALGNVVGSNICNLALILGMTAIIQPIVIQKNSLIIDWPVTMGSSLLLYVIVREGLINSGEGIIFLSLLIVYLTFLIIHSRKNKIINQNITEDLAEEEDETNTFLKDFAFILLGCAGLYFGAEWFVGSAKIFATELGVSERVIGLTVVAVGTSLPELVASSVAAFKKQTDIAVGNLMGSNIFNILGILGITSMIKNVKVSDIIINNDMIWMLAITLIILPLMLTRRNLGRLDGSILMVIYIYYTYSLVW